MRLSVIVPVFNVETYLGALLESLVAAVARLGGRVADPEVELICVDDGSTDASGRILDEFAARVRGEGNGFRLIVIHQENAGVAAARNRGLETAGGDWFLFADADDVLEPSAFAVIAGIVSDSPDVDLIGYGMHPFWGELKWPSSEDSRMTIGLGKEIPDCLMGMSVCQFAYRRQVFEAQRFRPYSVGEDLVFTAEAFAKARGCVIVGNKLYGYRFRADSATHASSSMAKFSDAVRFNLEMFRVMTDSGKRIGRAFTEGRGEQWLTVLPKEILRRHGEPGWNEVWEQWLDSMTVAAGMSLFSSGQRRKAAKVAAARTIWSVRWNILFPAWLERKGLLKQS